MARITDLVTERIGRTEIGKREQQEEMETEKIKKKKEIEEIDGD